MTTTESLSVATNYITSMQVAIDDQDWNKAFQAATWLANHYPLNSKESAHYSSQARQFALMASQAKEAKASNAEAFMDLLMKAMREDSANRTHVAPMQAPLSVSFNLGIEVQANQPPF